MVIRLVHMRVLPDHFVTPEKSKNLGTKWLSGLCAAGYYLIAS